MAPESSQIDELETQAFVQCLEVYENEVEEEDVHDWLNSYHQDLAQPESAKVPAAVVKDSLRSYAKEDIDKIYGKKIASTVSVDFDRRIIKRERLAREYPFLFVMREITTRMASTYFRVLRMYFDARRTGAEDIDTIREQVAVSSALLLRQAEAVIEQLKTPRTEFNLRHSFSRETLDQLIDFPKVMQESGFGNLFPAHRTNHYYRGSRRPLKFPLISLEFEPPPLAR